jgi:hypothetical protein
LEKVSPTTAVGITSTLAVELSRPMVSESVVPTLMKNVGRCSYSLIA